MESVITDGFTRSEDGMDMAIKFNNGSGADAVLFSSKVGRIEINLFGVIRS